MVAQYRPSVLILGGPDIDARISLMLLLSDRFQMAAAGSSHFLRDSFERAQLDYEAYSLSRGIQLAEDFSSLLEMISLYRRKRPMIAHTFDTKPCVLARLAARLTNVPIIIGTLPGIGSLYSGNTLSNKIRRAVYQPLQTLACHLSDLTIFQNPDDAAQFVTSGIVPKDKTAVLLGSGVETQVFDPKKFQPEQHRQIRTGLGLDEEKVVITMISRLLRSKGVLEFALAAQSIRERYPQVAFLLIGPDDSESVDALTIAEKSQVSKSVRQLGARDDIPELLAISDIFVLPTNYREGIPRVLLEAASMGLPLVATRAPGCTEVVEHNINGFLIPARDVAALVDAISKLVVDPPLRRKFGEASRRRAICQFDLSIVAEQTASIYTQLLAQKGYGNATHS